MNAVSAGPVRTLAARSIAGFPTMEAIVEERAPLHRPIDAEDVGSRRRLPALRRCANVTGDDAVRRLRLPRDGHVELTMSVPISLNHAIRGFVVVVVRAVVWTRAMVTMLMNCRATSDFSTRATGDGLILRARGRPRRRALARGRRATPLELGPGGSAIKASHSRRWRRQPPSGATASASSIEPQRRPACSLSPRSAATHARRPTPKTRPGRSRTPSASCE